MAKIPWGITDDHILQAIYDWLGGINELKVGASTSIADGGTISHGLSAAPVGVIAQVVTSGEFASVTALAASTFTVALKKHDNTAGTTQTVYWLAWR